MAESLDRAAPKIAEDLILSDMPLCQKDCARIAARVAVHLLGAPTSTADFLLLAPELAEGLFGDGFLKADGKQRAAWAQMCERALREEAKLSD